MVPYLNMCVCTMVSLLKGTHFQMCDLLVDGRGNTFVKNHFQKERSSLASFQL